METISEARQQDIFLNRILKRSSIKNLDDFLRTLQKILNKIRRLINVSKRKQSMNKQKLKIVVISFFDNSGIKNLLILILTSILDTKKVSIAIIDIDAYCAIYKLKRAQVFAMSIKDLEYQVEKEAKPETDLKNVILKEYYNFLDIFLKKDSNTLFSYRKYNY